MIGLATGLVVEETKSTPENADALRLHVKHYLDEIEKKTDDYDQESEGCKAFAHEQRRLLVEKYGDGSVKSMLTVLRKELASYVIEMNTGDPVGEDFDFAAYFGDTKNIEECQVSESCMSLLMADIYGDTQGVEEENDGYRYLCILLGQHMDESMIDAAYVNIGGFDS